MRKKSLAHHHAFRFIIFLGIVSLFADMTYEGARSITGSYLSVLGASAVTVGFVAGFGEFLGYSLRMVSGFIADRTGRYWMITIIGYVINLLAVPLIGTTHLWTWVAFLIILERVGKAIRTPARDAMLSHAGHQVGMGFGFGLHEALDQIGAMMGPSLVAIALYYHYGYQWSFIILFIPALLSLSMLLFARQQYPHPRDLEIKIATLNVDAHQGLFWIYVLASCFIAAGFIDFPLMAYHFQEQAVLSPVLIPIAYALAMGLDAGFSPLLGFCYDRFGFISLIIVDVFVLFFAPLVFLSHSLLWIYAGIVLWAVGVGAQGSIMRAVIGTITPAHQRASYYGIFNMCFGFAWFLGSLALGFIYQQSILLMVAVSMGLQLLGLPFLLLAFFKKQF